MCPSPEQENDEKVTQDLAGVEEGKALKKLLNSDDEDEEEEDKKEEEDKQEDKDDSDEDKKKKKGGKNSSVILLVQFCVYLTVSMVGVESFPQVRESWEKRFWEIEINWRNRNYV